MEVAGWTACEKNTANRIGQQTYQCAEGWVECAAKGCRQPRGQSWCQCDFDDCESHKQGSDGSYYQRDERVPRDMTSHAYTANNAYTRGAAYGCLNCPYQAVPRNPQKIENGKHRNA